MRAGRFLAAIAAAAAVLPSGEAPGRVDAVTAVAAGSPEPLLGVVRVEGKPNRLTRVDPTSLLPIGRARVPLRSAGSWAYWPDRGTLAITSHAHDVASSWPRAWIRLVDALRLRHLGDVALGHGWVYAVAWVAPDRVLALQQADDGAGSVAYTLDPVTRRVVERRVLDGDVIEARRTPRELVLLVARRESIGPAWLIVLGGHGSTRVDLAAIAAGTEATGVGDDPHAGRQRRPALAVDAAGRRAYVIPPDGAVAAVGLDTLHVTYHALGEPHSWLRRLLAWLEPNAEAKIVEGEVRYARWLGDGLIAVTGTDHIAAPPTTGGRGHRATPAGLKLIQAREWTVRTLDARATSFTFADGHLFATGFRADFVEQSTGTGVTVYDLDGAKRFSVLDGKVVHVGDVLDGRAYLWVGGRFDRRTVLDVRSGTVLGERKEPLPWLIRDPSWLDG